MPSTQINTCMMMMKEEEEVLRTIGQSRKREILLRTIVITTRQLLMRAIRRNHRGTLYATSEPMITEFTSMRRSLTPKSWMASMIGPNQSTLRSTRPLRNWRKQYTRMVVSSSLIEWWCKTRKTPPIERVGAWWSSQMGLSTRATGRRTNRMASGVTFT